MIMYGPSPSSLLHSKRSLKAHILKEWLFTYDSVFGFPATEHKLGLKSMFKLLHEDFVFHMASEGTTNNNEIKILIAHKKGSTYRLGLLDTIPYRNLLKAVSFKFGVKILLWSEIVIEMPALLTILWMVDYNHFCEIELRNSAQICSFYANLGKLFKHKEFQKQTCSKLKGHP